MHEQYLKRSVIYPKAEALVKLRELMGNQPYTDQAMKDIEVMSEGFDKIEIRLYYDPDTGKIKSFQPVVKCSKSECHDPDG